jgi:hypothetical protein
LFASRLLKLLAIDAGMYIVLFSLTGFILGNGKAVKKSLEAMRKNQADSGGDFVRISYKDTAFLRLLQRPWF